MRTTVRIFSITIGFRSRRQVHILRSIGLCSLLAAEDAMTILQQTGTTYRSDTFFFSCHRVPLFVP